MIFIPGTAAPHNAIRITGKITSGDGSIWIWANDGEKGKVNHYEMLKQFAVIADGVTIDENTYKVFRNARSDADTDCGGDYLTGQKGDDVNGWKCIYWTGSFDVVFLKTDAYGGWKTDTNGNKISEGLPGAVFTLYTDEACTSTYVMTFTSGDGVTSKSALSTSSDGTATYKDKNGRSVTLEKGEVLLSKVPPKTFYLKETTPPSGYNRVENKTTVYQVEVSSTGELTMRKKDASGEYKEIFKEKRREVTENGVKTDLVQYVVMNIPEAERKVILRKVNNTYASLQGAQFQIFHYDRTPVKSNNETIFTSSASGVYFIDKLPYGVYYLFEKTAPTGYTSGKWFTLTVSNDNANGSRDGVTVAEITDAALLTRLNQSIGNS